MPFVDLEPRPLNAPLDRPEGGYVTPGLDQMHDQPTFEQIGSATMRTENSIESAVVSNFLGASREDDPDLKPFDEIKGTKYEPHWQSFVNVRNREQLTAKMRDLDREAEDRKIIEAAPWWMTVPASLLANVTDPTILMPGGAFTRGAKGGISMARTAVSTGLMTGASQGLQEVGLHASQNLRTPADSAIQIGVGTVLGGVLGAGGAALLTRAETRAAMDNLNRDLAAPADAEARLAVPDSPVPGSVGAAAVVGPDLDKTAIAGTAAGGLAKAKINPGLRLSQSPNPATREVGLNLFEMSQYIRGNEEGLATPIAAETLRKEWNAGLMQAVSDLRESYTGYRKGGGPMSSGEFNQAVGRAMRRGDQDAIPEVAKVAQAWRRNVFDPLKEAAIEAKLLPEDVSVDTAVSYFSRLWDRKRLIAEEGEFKRVVTSYYGGVIAKEHERASTNLQRRLGKLDQEAQDIQLDKAGRESAISEVEGGLGSQEMHPQFEAATRLDEMQRELRRVRDDETASKTVREQIAAAKKTGGDDLKTFMQERADLRERRRNLNLGYAGLQERSDRLLESLADLEESNVRSLNRLIDKGRRFEREAQRLEPDKFEQHLADLKSAFADILKREDAAAQRIAKVKQHFAEASTAAEQKVKSAGEKSNFDALKALGETAPKVEAAGQKARQAAGRFEAAQATRADRLSKLAERIASTEAFDPLDALAKVRATVDELVAQVGGASLGRGERAARLTDRLERLNPEIVKDRLKDIGKRKGALDQAFRDTWETKRLGEGVGTKEADFSEMAKDIASHAFNTLTGRTTEGVRPEFVTIGTRGPMKDRTLNIPDELVEKWLESDIEAVGARYQRIMSADVELARKFGTPDMKEALQKVRDGYDKMRAGVSDEKQLTALAKQERADIRDLEGVRDIIRGTYPQSRLEQDWGHVFRIAQSFEYVLKMGQVVLSSLTEPVRVAAAKGLLPYMSAAFSAATNPRAFKIAVGEARLAGNVNDKILSHRLFTFADMGDFYGSRGPVEKFMMNMSNVASNWNGIRIWTDWGKMNASILIQNQILGAAKSFTGAGVKQQRYLNFLGIDESMAGRIAKQFEQHGEVLGGIHSAGTANWTDEVARRAYRAALNKDLDSMVVTRGAADVPLFANTAIGRLIFQFNTFNLASHQRILLRGLQEGPARFLASVVALSSIGMVQAYLKAIASNSVNKLPDFHDNPGWWIAEGLDQSGMFMVPMQVANWAELMTGVNPLKAPLKLGDVGKQESQKLRNRNAGSLAGPAVSSANDLITVGKVPGQVMRGEDVTQAQKNAAERLIPFNSYYGMRQMLKYIVNPPQE